MYTDSFLHWFSWFGKIPDITVLGKALGGGMADSAVVAHSELMDALVRARARVLDLWQPVNSAAALAVLIEEEGLVEGGTHP